VLIRKLNLNLVPNLAKRRDVSGKLRAKLEKRRKNLNKAMTKEELNEKLGKNGFLADNQSLSGILTYENGISSFDEYLNGKTLKEINAVIHLTKHPKGFAIKIVKNFSSFLFALEFSEINKTVVSENTETSHLIFETKNQKIIFSFKKNYFLEVEEFLNEINHKYDKQNLNIEIKTNLNQTILNNNPVNAYVVIVSSLIIVIGSFMPWVKVGILFQQKGIDTSEGAIVLVLAIISGAVAVFNLSKKENKNTWIFTISGLICALISYFYYSEINNKTSAVETGINKLSSAVGGTEKSLNIDLIGPGLYIIILGSIGLLISGLIIFKQENKNDIGNKEE